MASSIVETKPRVESNAKDSVTIYEYLITAHTDGSVTAVDTSPIEGYVFMVTTNPGVAPAAAWDLTLLDTDGIDIMEAGLTNRSATASEQEVPLIGGVSMSRYVRGPLTITPTNMDNNGATAVVKIHFYRDKK